MITTKYCNISACFDSSIFMYFAVTAPLKEHQYENNIQNEYNLTFEDFTCLEIMIATTVDKYIKNKKENLCLETQKKKI